MSSQVTSLGSMVKLYSMSILSPALMPTAREQLAPVQVEVGVCTISAVTVQRVESLRNEAFEAVEDPGATAHPCLGQKPPMVLTAPRLTTAPVWWMLETDVFAGSAEEER